jgi:hypothetical protein
MRMMAAHATTKTVQDLRVRETSEAVDEDDVARA